MSFLDLVKKRYSCRDYMKKEIPDDMLGEILEAARLAPTAKNSQSFKIVIIETEKHKEKLLDIYNRDWFVSAPYVLVVCGSKTDSWVRIQDDRRNHVVDASSVMDHIILAAADNDLGTCWICAFDPGKTKNFLNLPEDFEPIAMTPLGYANDNPRDKKRKSIDDLIIHKD